MQAYNFINLYQFNQTSLKIKDFKLTLVRIFESIQYENGILSHFNLRPASIACFSLLMKMFSQISLQPRTLTAVPVAAVKPLKGPSKNRNVQRMACHRAFKKRLRWETQVAGAKGVA